jgi:hypothetical protein
LGLGTLEDARVIIRRYIVTVVAEDPATDKDMCDALETGLEGLPAANRNTIVLESERRSDADRGVDPYGTIEQNLEWCRLAEKELTDGRRT